MLVHSCLIVLFAISLIAWICNSLCVRKKRSIADDDYTGYSQRY